MQPYIFLFRDVMFTYETLRIKQLISYHPTLCILNICIVKTTIYLYYKETATVCPYQSRRSFRITVGYDMSSRL
jgi:hypothetical protein